MGLFIFSIFLFCAAALACVSPFETPNFLVFKRDSPTSTDGNCGSNSDTNSTCLTSTFGNCCSPKGYCGSTLAYCGPGCQSDFGTCSDSSTQTISTSGSCGATSTSNLTCLGSTFGDCCSHLGYCGGNSSYCGNGCNDKFGSCGADAQTVIDGSPTSSSSSPFLSSAPPPTAPSVSSSSANSTTPIVTSTQQPSLSIAAKAGIAISAALAFLLAFILLFYILRSRRSQPVKLPASEIDSDPFSQWEKQPEIISIPRPIAGTPGQVYEMAAGGERDPAELASTSTSSTESDGWAQRRMEAKIKQERRKALVDDRVRAGYEGAFRGN